MWVKVAEEDSVRGSEEGEKKLESKEEEPMLAVSMLAVSPMFVLAGESRGT